MGCRASHGGWKSLKAFHTSVHVALCLGHAQACTLVSLSQISPIHVQKYICCWSVSYLKFRQILLCLHATVFRKISRSSGFAGDKLDQNNFLLSIKAVVTLRLRHREVCLFSLEPCPKNPVGAQCANKAALLKCSSQ